MHYRWNAGEGGPVRILTFILSPSIHPRCPRATDPARRGRRYDDCAGAKEYRAPRRECFIAPRGRLRGDNRVVPSESFSPSSLSPFLPHRRLSCSLPLDFGFFFSPPPPPLSLAHAASFAVVSDSSSSSSLVIGHSSFNIFVRDDRY